MLDFKIEFSHPWLLLLLIPAVIFTLIPYFRLSKRYRKTRNRITSIVLHLIVSVLAISLLAGMNFVYRIPNKENELILLVDVSDTEAESQDARDELIQLILDEGQYDNYNIGIVTFGFDQRYAVPLTSDINSIYDAYLHAELPDTTATNVADALLYAKDMFTNPQTGKIVLISDGKETDKQAYSVIRSVAAQGIRVDTAYIPSSYTGDAVQLLGVEFPDYYIGVDEICSITLSLQSAKTSNAIIELYDNGELLTDNDRLQVVLDKDLQTFTFQHTFVTGGLHELSFRIIIAEDELPINNEYCAYYYLEVYDKVLILEAFPDTSAPLVDLLKDTYQTEIVAVSDDNLPKTIEGLLQYDQIILNNVSSKDLKEKNLDVLLDSYVYEHGGGIFTVGGNNENSTDAYAYNREDMLKYGAVYQKMLPVQAIDYKPPIGVVVIIDKSGSMNTTDNNGDSMLEWAKSGAYACMKALGEKDYMAIMTLDDEPQVILEMTPRTQESKIDSAIKSIDKSDGGTVFANSIKQARGDLLALDDSIDKRHIIIISDCQANDPVDPDTNEPKYMKEVRACADANITISVIGCGVRETDKYGKNMQVITDTTGGRLHAVANMSEEALTEEVIKDLEVDEIVAVNYKDFAPMVTDLTSPLLAGITLGEGVDRNKLTTTLGGFYGVKARQSAKVILAGEYGVPIYAQWGYGEGMVGSFMCDLAMSNWSDEFMGSDTGKQFVNNVVKNLMPTQNIRPNEIEIELREDNYTNELINYTSYAEGEYFVGKIIKKTASGDIVLSMNEMTSQEDRATQSNYITLELSEKNDYSRCNFVIKESGVYQIVFTKYNAENQVVAEYSTYKSFAYSEEYDSFVETTGVDFKAELEKLAIRGNGELIDDNQEPWEVFDGFVTSIEKNFDPRFLFMILAIVGFLLDIAVRKFKFKWPHELIREYKEKKSAK